MRVGRRGPVICHLCHVLVMVFYGCVGALMAQMLRRCARAGLDGVSGAIATYSSPSEAFKIWTSRAFIVKCYDCIIQESVPSNGHNISSSTDSDNGSSRPHPSSPAEAATPEQPQGQPADRFSGQEAIDRYLTLYPDD